MSAGDDASLSSNSVRVERAGGLAVLTFDSPPLNLLDRAMSDAIASAVAGLEADLPRALLVRAEGRVVSGGVDVALFAEHAGSAEATVLLASLLALSEGLEALPCPTVFAAHALCLTWAFELALACDIILAAESAKFGLVERVIGLTPTMGGTQRIAERAGSGRARELVMTGALYPATTLERWNVVNRVLPDEGFDAAARAFVAELADGPTCAHGVTKRVCADFREGGVARADERVVGRAAALFDSDDLQAAVRSFLDEGPGRARFSGR